MNTFERIEEIRRKMGDKLLILAHHYQRPSVIAHADRTGDSLELARAAALEKKAERIVFCGVKFMAETADILTGAGQSVYMPEVLAGCPMANMADSAAMEGAWRMLQSNGQNDWLPVVYVNSTAEIKALCGRLGGSACTSSNAAKIMDWAFKQGKRVLFLPDEHLGANTAHDMGISDDQVVVIDSHDRQFGVRSEMLANAKVAVWRGFCIVHVTFTVEDVRQIREKDKSAKIIVHPETPKEVVRLCDAHGSTAQIIKYVDALPDGSTVYVGTELNLVQRLADQHAGRLTIKTVRPSLCANMAKTNEENLLAILETWPKDNLISVSAEIAGPAKLCLERMINV